MRLISSTQAQHILENCDLKNYAEQIYSQLRKLKPDFTQVLIIASQTRNVNPLQALARKLLDFDISVHILYSEDDNLQFEESQNNPAHFADFILDFLGTDSLDGQSFGLIRFVNQLSGTRIALECPAGLNSQTGNIDELAFRARFTFCIHRPRPGFFLNQGPRHCGRVVVIPLPKNMRPQSSPPYPVLLSQNLVRKWLPIRQETDNKTQGGRTLIWAGQTHMPGAAVLAAQAAARMGAGYIYVVDSEVLQYFPESIIWNKKNLETFQAVLIGPGLGFHQDVENAIKKLAKNSSPVVIDADALTVAAQKKLFPFPSHWVATPHAGELSRILKISSHEIERDRIKAVRLAVEKLGCTVVLKGYHTVVAFRQEVVIIPTGNVALAKGGSGDVLAGMITGLISQKVSPERAALSACYIHGLVADAWIESGRDFLSMTPSDLIQTLPFALNEIRKF